MSELQLRPLTPTFGVEIRGLDPQIPLDEETCLQLRELFDERSVLVFPELDIDESVQAYLCYMLIGESFSSGVGDADTATEAPLQIVSNKEAQASAPYGRLMFHCDTMWAERPQPVISLYGLEIEQPNAPTLFVAMGAAWDALSDELRQRLQGLDARHGHDHSYANRGGDDDVIDAYFENAVWTITPIANPHPRTGRVGLYVSEQVTMDICGLSEAENESLLAELFAHLYRPDRILQHHWHQHDLVIWDNNAVQHARTTVPLDGPTRTLRKITGPYTISPEEVSQPKFSKVSSQ